MGPNERIACMYCDSTFSRKSNLKKHLKIVCKGRNQVSLKATGAGSKISASSMSNSWNKKKHKPSKTVDTPPRNALRMPKESETVSSSIQKSLGSIFLADDMKYINELCDRAQKNKKSVLVIAVDYEKYQTFGSELGKQFLKEHSSIIAQFLLYCKDKNSALKESTVHNESKSAINTDKEKKSIKPAKSTSELVIIKPSQSSNHSDTKDAVNNKSMDVSTASSNDDTDDYITVKSELEATNGIEEHDSDDDFIDENDQGDEVDNDTNDDDDDEEDDINQDTKGDDNDDNKGSNLHCSSCTREEFFQEVGQDFMNEEHTKAVEYILKKTFGPITKFTYTVPDLNTGKYHCDQCGYNFLWKVHLDTHQAKFPNCKEVPIVGNELEALDNEITYVHTELNVTMTSKLIDLYQSCRSLLKTCVICGCNNITTTEKFSQHLIEHFNDKTFRCNICNTAFASIKNISAHLREHFRKPYDCHKCSWRFQTYDKLKMHTQGGCSEDTKEKMMTIKSAEDIADCAFKCTICFTVIVGHNELREHMSLDHQCTKDPLQCVMCDKKFEIPELYYTHVYDHQEQRQKCPYCSETFPLKNNAYQYHLYKHEEMPYVCDICGEKFKYRRYFNIHRRTHTGERPYICSVEGCKKGFRSKDYLKQHKWTHEKIHFLCSFCGRKFKSPNHLNNHKKTHTIEWRYPCIYCDDKFHQLLPFKKHLACKHPEKILDVKEKFSIILHSCTLCQKVFCNSEKFRDHMNNHNGIKPYKCEHCEKCFTDKSNMRNHMKSHFGGKKLKCDQCSRKFDDPKYLEIHIQKHHGENSRDKVHNQIKKNLPDEKKNMFLPAQDEMYSYAIGEQRMLAIDDVDEIRESTLQIIDEKIQEEAKF